jgi:hypothetical protein
MGTDTRRERIASIGQQVQEMTTRLAVAINNSRGGLADSMHITAAEQRIIGYVEGIASAALPWDGWKEEPRDA